MRLRVIDLDSSVALQPAMIERASRGDAYIADFRNTGPGLRVIALRSGIRSFVSGLDSTFGSPDGRPEVFFYGSGDFHHLTAALISRVKEPLTVVHFDNHPDWCQFPNTFNCGAWVNRALDLPQVLRVITIGPCGTDLVKPELQTANLAAVRDGRLEIYPWRAAPSRVWRRYRDTKCCRYADGHLHWRNLADEPWDRFLDEMTARLPDAALWITIDKDVLAGNEAITNWDQGQMRLDQVIEGLERLAAVRRIAGIDVCGEYSAPVFADPIRGVIARFDNPPKPVRPAEALVINARTNVRLLEAFERVLDPGS